MTMRLIEKIGDKYFTDDGTVQLSSWEAKKDAGTFILSILLAFLASFVYDEDIIILVAMFTYIFLRYKQRGPFSDT